AWWCDKSEAAGKREVVEEALSGTDRRASILCLDGGDKVVILLERLGLEHRMLQVEVRYIPSVQALQIVCDPVCYAMNDGRAVPQVRVITLLSSSEFGHIELHAAITGVCVERLLPPCVVACASDNCILCTGEGPSIGRGGLVVVRVSRGIADDAGYSHMD